MNLYHVTRLDSPGYDEYDGIVVAAHRPETAARVRPGGDFWPGPDGLRVELVGRAASGRQFKDGQIVLGRFKAG